MTDYVAPLRALSLALDTVGLGDLLELDRFAAVSRNDVDDVLGGFAAVAEKAVAPTDREGDRVGARFDAEAGTVVVPAGFHAAWSEYVNGGWGGLCAEGELGGGFPGVVGVATHEMFASANMALSLCAILTHGAVDLLQQWGSDDQRARLLPPLVSGEWNGTMCLTEPEAGSDLGAVSTTAIADTDGRYRINGTKVFITWGDHDLTPNTIHLVLARTPGAPAGTKGLSVFAVPRRSADGTTNDVTCLRLEEKLGIHASPTCVLEFDGAVGELVGEECGGIAAMFTMMNAARLLIGLQGAAVSERAYQEALEYANERRQGAAPGASRGTASPIVEHPDVRRMLLTMASGVDAMRLVLLATGAAADLATHGADEPTRAAARARVDLLTPIAKGWPTDEGVRLTSQAVQIFGGMGFMQECPASQRYRDMRITPIYEGTNGVQAVDLALRKIVADDAAALGVLIGELRADAEAMAGVARLAGLVGVLTAGVDALEAAGRWVASRADRIDVLAGSTVLLELAGVVLASGLLARQARLAAATCPEPEADAVAARAAFFMAERLPLVPGLLEVITSGAARLDPVGLRR